MSCIPPFLYYFCIPNFINQNQFEIEQEFSSFDCFLTKDNTPPMPLSDAHLGGLFFL